MPNLRATTSGRTFLDAHDGAGGKPYVPPEAKPRFRGIMHAWAFVASLPAGALLIVAAAGNTAERWVALIYATSLTGLFGASAAHHRWTGTPWGRPWLRWLDHSMIYVLIAGSYTPLCLVALSQTWRVAVLVAVWSVAVAGVVIKLTRLHRFRRSAGALYLVMGWAAVIVLPQFARRLPPASMTLMAVGGLLYTAGAVVLFRRRPDPLPSVFGYHELWHALVVGAGACHFAMIFVALHSLPRP